MRRRAPITPILRSGRPSPERAPSSLDEKLADEARFFRTWVDAPGLTGAVSPSGRFLARAMARCVDPTARGLVVELGPGTGPVTEALIARGVAPERLVLVEYSETFCALLRARFPRATVIQGDAYRLRDTVDGLGDAAVSAVVSSLPLLNRPDAQRRALLDEAFDLMGPEGLFVQFTYGLSSPVPLRRAGDGPAVFAEADAPVWLNLPPARVWRYRHVGHYARKVEPARRARLDAALWARALGQRPVVPTLARMLKRLADSAEGMRNAPQ